MAEGMHGSRIRYWMLLITGVAVVPMLIVLDLSTGGTGWGLCPDGMDACQSSYFAGPELLGLLAAALFVGVALVAACVRGLRALRRRPPAQSA